jgi:hypothetical protein
VWATKGSFEDIIVRYGASAGLLDASGRLKLRIEKGGGDRVVSALVAGLARLNPLATVIDTSPYDRAMRRLHNYMKDDAGFRADMEGYRELRFPPHSAWMCFTDGVSHASLEGQFALVTTMIVRRERMRDVSAERMARHDHLVALGAGRDHRHRHAAGGLEPREVSARRARQVR